ncbi:MAG: tRNA pseudouridine(55) synthase TruB [bacterium]
MIILIDKPKHITSFDVIRILRRKAKIKKMGHAGTLDPLASGLLIVATEQDTKKLNNFLKLDKQYIANALFGLQTDTGDMEGRIIQEQYLESIDMEKFKEILSGMIGKSMLRVPIYSAIKSGGEALYKKAQRGEHVIPPKKEMNLISASIIDKSFKKEIINGHSCVSIGINFFVGSGTYIRTLIEELGRRLDVPATLKDLRRTKIGDYNIEEAIKITIDPNSGIASVGELRAML